jgi:hypothetical protein
VESVHDGFKVLDTVWKFIRFRKEVALSVVRVMVKGYLGKSEAEHLFDNTVNVFERCGVLHKDEIVLARRVCRKIRISARGAQKSAAFAGCLLLAVEKSPI